tara:strand:+ start:529 stop:1005 length:477 start_codon:yes stop_codon:yes gene_type:complete
MLFNAWSLVAPALNAISGAIKESKGERVDWAKLLASSALQIAKHGPMKKGTDAASSTEQEQKPGNETPATPPTPETPQLPKDGLKTPQASQAALTRVPMSKQQLMAFRHSPMSPTWPPYKPRPDGPGTQMPVPKPPPTASLMMQGDENKKRYGWFDIA